MENSEVLFAVQCLVLTWRVFNMYKHYVVIQVCASHYAGYHSACIVYTYLRIRLLCVCVRVCRAICLSSYVSGCLVFLFYCYSYFPGVGKSSLLLRFADNLFSGMNIVYITNNDSKK